MERESFFGATQFEASSAGRLPGVMSSLTSLRTTELGTYDGDMQETAPSAWIV